HREVAADVMELDRSDLPGQCFGRRLCVIGRRVDHHQRGAICLELVCHCHLSASSSTDQKSGSWNVGSRSSLKAPMPSMRSGWTAERQCASIMIAIACSIGCPSPMRTDRLTACTAV